MAMRQLYSEESILGKPPEERSLEECLQYGVVCIDKPQGPTSHEVSAFVKKILHTGKTGHTGTLDANVSGVLPVLLNNSCKTAHFIAERNKTYVCIMHLSKEVGEKELQKAFLHFRGKIYQTPPLASAVAKKLRMREVFELKILEVEGRDVLFSVSAEAGFYVRNLVFDIGEILGIRTEMAELRRTKAGKFVESDCLTLQELSDNYWLSKERGKEDLKKFITPIEDVLGLRRVIAADGALHAICTGAHLAIPGIMALDEKISKGERVGIYTGKGELVAVATALMSANEIKPGEKGWAFDVERVIHSF